MGLGEISLYIFGIVLACLGFFVVKWIHGVEKNYEQFGTRLSSLTVKIDELINRVTNIENSYVSRSNCDKKVSLHTQKVNRERHRVNTLETKVQEISGSPRPKIQIHYSTTDE